MECVNPLAATRDGWLGTAETAGAVLIEVEVICSDEAEHRRRVETRTSDVEGLAKPTWTAVVEREYEPWTRERLVIDSATTSPQNAAYAIATKMAADGEPTPTTRWPAPARLNVARILHLASDNFTLVR